MHFGRDLRIKMDEKRMSETSWNRSWQIPLTAFLLLFEVKLGPKS